MFQHLQELALGELLCPRAHSLQDRSESWCIPKTFPMHRRKKTLQGCHLYSKNFKKSRL